MKNRLTDLNNYLFAQLERLDDEQLTQEELQLELERSKSISAISNQIISNANVQLKAAELAAEYGRDANFSLGGLLERTDD